MLSWAVLKDVRWLSACTDQARDINNQQNWAAISKKAASVANYFKDISARLAENSPTEKKIFAFIREN
jgi:hypothetical protein